MAYKHINTNGTVTIQKSTVCFNRIVVGKAGSADWVVEIYNGVDTNGDVVSINNLNAGGNYEYYTSLSAGLTVQTTGTTPGDITIIYD